MKTLEEALTKVHELDYLVNNLYEDDNGRWTCSLRAEVEGENLKENMFYEYGRGSTPVEAVTIAIHNAEAVWNLSNQAARRRVIRDA
jgi:hypothetical protein